MAAPLRYSYLESPLIERPSGLQSMRLQELDMAQSSWYTQHTHNGLIYVWPMSGWCSVSEP